MNASELKATFLQLILDYQSKGATKAQRDIKKLTKEVNENTKANKKHEQSVEKDTKSEQKREKQTKKSKKAEAALAKEEKKSSDIIKKLTILKNKEGKATGLLVTKIRRLDTAESEYRVVMEKSVVTNERQVASMLKAAKASDIKTAAIVKDVTASNALIAKQNMFIGMSTKSLDTFFKKMNYLRWTMVNLMFVAAGFAAVLAPIILLTKQAMKMQNAMADVAKKAGLSAGETKKLKEEMYKLSTIVPVSAKDLADIAKVAGQLGIAKENISDFVYSVSLISTATDVAADKVATGLAKIANAFNIPVENVLKLGSVINKLENTTAATTEDMVTSLQRAGAAAVSLGVSYQFTAGALATLVSSGMSAQRAGTRLRNLYMRIQMDTTKSAEFAGMKYEDFMKLLEEKPDAAVLAVLKGLRNETDALSESTKAYGRIAGFAAVVLSNSFENLSKNINTANKELETGASIWDAYVKKYSTASAQFKMLGNDILDTMEGVGEETTKLSGKMAYFFRIATGGGVKLARHMGESTKKVRELVMSGTLSDAEREELVKRIKEYSGINPLLALNIRQPQTVKEYNEIQKFNTYNPNFALLANYYDFFIKRHEENTKAVEKEKSAYDQLSEMYGDNANKVKILVDAYKARDEAMNSGDVQKYIEAVANVANDEANIKSLVGEDVGASIIAFAQNAAKAFGDLSTSLTDTANVMSKYFNFAIKIANHQLKEYNDELSRVNDNIKELSSAKFTGQTAVERLIEDVNLFKKKQDLLNHGITDPYDFLTQAVNKSRNGLDQFLNTVNSVTDATQNSQDSYKAWQETVQEFIKDAITQGNDLRHNVSGAVQTYKTLLLSTSKFREGSKQQADVVSLLQEAYDVYYGGMSTDVKRAIEDHDEEGRKVYDSSSSIIDALRNQWLEQDRYSKKVSDTKKEVNSLSEELWNAQLYFDAYNLGIDSSIKKLDALKNAAIAAGRAQERVLNKGTHHNSHYTYADLHNKVEVITNANASPNSGFASSGDPFRDFLNGRWDKAGDLIWRAGQEPIIVSPQDNIVASKSDSGVGGVTINNLNISGITGDANNFASEFVTEIKRQLRTQ